MRLRLPFRPADDGWRDALEWYEGYPPYGHQAAAFARLSSLGDRRPQPTLVTTGTGSGKTEAFLYPILDHVLRARREGITGTKALILYPMNALANDQAQRLTQLITAHPELRAVTAALYTGQKGPTADDGHRGRADHRPRRSSRTPRPTSCSPTTRCSTSSCCAPATRTSGGSPRRACATWCSTSSTPTTARRAPTSRCCCAASGWR